MSHPYADLPRRAFWRHGTARAVGAELFEPNFPITRATRIATAGSCFAQHIARSLRGAGCKVLDAEPPPRGMGPDLAARHGYGLFSGRYGNIYTARQLRQLLTEIVSGAPEQRFVWRRGALFVDALRPTVEPEGLDSPDEVMLHRDYHLERTSQMLQQADLFIFTLGLTEAWRDRNTGRVFPVCPGVTAGRFDAAAHEFVTFSQAEVLEDLRAIRVLLQRFRPGMQMLLTVSPVPLTATAGGAHVLVASQAAKATLRSAAGEFAAGTAGVSYFPSYEIVTTPAFGGPHFEPDLRRVTQGGVDLVMQLFLDAHGLESAAPPESQPQGNTDPQEADDPVCDELLLEAFAK